MKKFYLKPESRFVDINLNESVLENPNEDPISGVEGGSANSSSPWDGYDNMPTNKAVWGENEEEE